MRYEFDGHIKLLVHTYTFLVGAIVGRNVKAIGATIGAMDGRLVGALVGRNDGMLVGGRVGTFVGGLVGIDVHCFFVTSFT